MISIIVLSILHQNLHLFDANLMQIFAKDAKLHLFLVFSTLSAPYEVILDVWLCVCVCVPCTELSQEDSGRRHGIKSMTCFFFFFFFSFMSSCRQSIQRRALVFHYTAVLPPACDSLGQRLRNSCP